MTNFLYFVLGVIAWQILKSLYLILEIELRKRRERRFLNLVNIVLPEHGAVTIIASDTSDKKALAKIEKELRDRFDQPS
jgi:hypothetical protein